MSDTMPGPVAVVENDAVCRRALGRVLRAGGFEATLFPSAEAFLEDQNHHAWLCLIVDVHLTGMSGLELQRRVHHDHAALPIIVATGDRSDRVREDAEHEGCLAFMLKPVSAHSLFGVLRSITPASIADPRDI